MAKKQVALVLSGGVSLGSYIAGALDELLAALAAASADYEIDIITGASAGATTAALIAHSLLYRNGVTALHRAWVEAVDMVDLLAPSVPAAEGLSLLSGQRLVEIAGQELAWPPGSVAHRAAFCADHLTVAMTLANVTALQYVSRVPEQAAGRSESFAQLRNSEQQTFRLGPDLAPTDPLWQNMATVARASAAIPFVFPLVELPRTATNPDHYIQQPNFSGSARFWYYDGGTFNNLPIDLAARFAAEAGNLANRVVIVVNPWRNAATAVAPVMPRPNLFTVAGNLLTALVNESTAVQFEREVLHRPLASVPSGVSGPDGVAEPPPAPDPAGGERDLPGVDPAPVELLGQVALIMPRPTDLPLRGNHLHALAAFLDRRFREYDFRRGAADAQATARAVLGLAYPAPQPVAYYAPETDPALAADLSAYERLGDLPSSHASAAGRSVRAVFEDALDRRIDALLHAWNAPGPDFVIDPLLAALIKPLLRAQLPVLWLPKAEQGRRP